MCVGTQLTAEEGDAGLSLFCLFYWITAYWIVFLQTETIRKRTKEGWISFTHAQSSTAQQET